MSQATTASRACCVLVGRAAPTPVPAWKRETLEMLLRLLGGSRGACTPSRLAAEAKLPCRLHTAAQEEALRAPAPAVLEPPEAVGGSACAGAREPGQLPKESAAEEAAELSTKKEKLLRVLELLATWEPAGSARAALKACQLALQNGAGASAAWELPARAAAAAAAEDTRP